MKRKGKIVFKCQQCGKCCKKYVGVLKSTVDDIERWKREGREDILKYVYIFEIDGYVLGGDLWFDPRTGRELSKCPFLKRDKDKMVCLIHDTKPNICREFPFADKGKIDISRKNECKGIRLV